MRRREFIVLVGGAAAWPVAGIAQQATMLIGFLSALEAYPSSLNAFRNGLAETGYYESRNVLIEYRWAEGHYDRLPSLALELAQRRVSVIVAGGGSPSGLAAKAVTSTIPIVVLLGDDPVKLGLASSINRPSGNVTGVAQLVVAAQQKRLELLRELVPAADTIAYLMNPASPNADRQRHDMDADARALGLKLVVLQASSERDLVEAFTTIVQKRIGALILGADPFFFMQQDQIVALSARYAIPTMYFFREFATAGGLISYGTRLAEGWHQVGVYTGKILRGANPADLPFVQQSEKIELVVNLRAARMLGLDVPLSLLTRADELIE